MEVFISLFFAFFVLSTVSAGRNDCLFQNFAK